MQQYLDAIKQVLAQGTRKENRTGVDTLSTFGLHYNIDLSEGFPLLTTKAVKWSNIVVENLWFLSGSTDVGFLRHYGVKFWDPWVDAEGRVPSAYGNFWRSFPVHGRHVEVGKDEIYSAAGGPKKLALEDLVAARHNDQLKWAVETLHRDLSSRRVIISAWAPGNAQASKLPPCHVLWALNVQNLPNRKARSGQLDWQPTADLLHDLQTRLAPVEPRLCLHLTQRSCDMALGVPYNIAGYGFVLELMSRFIGVRPGILSHTLVDAHIYTKKPGGSMAEYDHVPGLLEQLTRTPRPRPWLTIDNSIQSLEDVERLIRDRPPVERLLELFRLDGYQPCEAIPFKVAV